MFVILKQKFVFSYFATRSKNLVVINLINTSFLTLYNDKYIIHFILCRVTFRPVSWIATSLLFLIHVCVYFCLFSMPLCAVCWLRGRLQLGCFRYLNLDLFPFFFYLPHLPTSSPRCNKLPNLVGLI